MNYKSDSSGVWSRKEQIWLQFVWHQPNGWRGLGSTMHNSFHALHSLLHQLKINRLFKAETYQTYAIAALTNVSVFHSPVFIKPSEGRVLIMGCLPVSCTLNVHPKCIVSFSKMKNRKLEAVDAAEDITFQLAALQMVTASFLHTWVLLSFGF